MVGDVEGQAGRCMYREGRQALNGGDAEQACGRQNVVFGRAVDGCPATAFLSSMPALLCLPCPGLTVHACLALSVHVVHSNSSAAGSPFTTETK